VADRHDREEAAARVVPDLADLGTIREQDLEEARTSSEHLERRRTARAAVVSLERDGRLLIR